MLMIVILTTLTLAAAKPVVWFPKARGLLGFKRQAKESISHKSSLIANNMNDKQFAKLSPEYKQILTEVGVQLSVRKGILFKRTLLKIWPTVVLVLLGYFDKYFKDFITQNSLGLSLNILFVVWLIFMVFYTTIFGSILEIEKRVWIDSFFDGKKLDGQQSWRIARRLFGPVLKLYISMFLRYYLPLYVAFILGIISIFGAIWQVAKNENQALLLLVVGVTLIFGSLIYSYFFLRVKLRYIWFVFLDLYKKEGFSRGQVFEEMNKLNSIAKSDSFKKALVINLGTDSVNVLADISVDAITYGISQLGRVGETVGSVVNVVGKEASRQATSFANIAAMYILYRFAREQLFGKEQEVNENIYKLAE